jgi:hypothetical protein
VLATALQIIDRDGVDGLTMRRLGRALDRDPMSLYRHAPTKASLLDGVAEIVLEQLTVDSTDPDWAGQLRTIAREFRRLTLTHPQVVPLLGTRSSQPVGLRPLGTCGHWKPSWNCSPALASPDPTPCTSTGRCSASCTATSSTNYKRSSNVPRKPTTCSAWAYTACRSASSPSCAASPPSWPPTTAPQNSNAASTSCSPAWQAHSPPAGHPQSHQLNPASPEEASRQDCQGTGKHKAPEIRRAA